MQPENIKPEVMANAIEIYAGLEVEDGKSYRPSNGTEGEIFTSRWCNRCRKDSFIKSCNILVNALCGGYPSEWLYQGNKPVCTAFVKRDEP